MRPSNKLNFVKLKFFKILKVLKPVTHKLNLSDSIKVIKIRHILVLKLTDSGTPLIKNVPDIDLKSQEKVWEIKRIINSKLINNNKRKYLVKWKKYPYSNNTWEPIKNLYCPKKL